MNFTDIILEQKSAYNDAVTHPLQSFEWGEFRKKTGITIIRRGQVISSKEIKNAYTMTLHKVPHLPFRIGYLPKGTMPTEEMIADIVSQAKRYACIYIQLEPNILEDKGAFEMEQLALEKRIPLRHSFHPLFTKYTLSLDITPSEETLLSHMHPKTRYNIRIAVKHNVRIVEDNSEKGFEDFMRLYNETTTRQRFYAHTPQYHKTLWENLGQEGKAVKNQLGYHLLHARVDINGVEKTLTSWVLFSFHDELYYPYGASSRENREMMASNLIMWESILLGKKKNLKTFDMWGALGPEPDTNDPWYGFHKFKQGYGATLTEFVGSYDLVINPIMYEGIKLADRLRWEILKLKKRI